MPVVISNLLLVVGLVLAWVSLAPTNIGGKVSYVMIKGNSMEPKFHAGDLVLVRKASSYQVGDIVTYWDNSMAAYTIHRIIDTKQDRFVLKGDNNSWIDPSEPGQEEIIGKLWIHLPRLGKIVEWLQSPIHFALVMGLSGGILMTGMVLNPKKNKARERITLNPNGVIGIMFYVLGLMFFASLALAFYAFSRPISSPSNNMLYQQEGQFYYSAIGTPGIYDTSIIQSGEPVFPKLTCTLNVGFSYNLIGNSIQSMAGNHLIYARVVDPQSGWNRTISMGPMLSFSGTSFSNSGTIDLCQVEALIATLKRETGLRSSTYTMEITSAVNISGIVAGETINDSFTPVLPFKFDEAHFYIDSGDLEQGILNASKPTMSNGASLQPNMLSLLGFILAVQAARIIAIVGLVLTSTALLSMGLYIYFTVQKDPNALIHLKYGSLLVEVYEGAYEPVPPVIDVASIDSLAKLAERHNTMILHVSRDFLQDYLVQSNSTTYRYSISNGEQKTTARRHVNHPGPAMSLNSDQPQIPNNQQPYQDLRYWGPDAEYYELESTQPSIPVQRNRASNPFGNELENHESDRTIFLGKIKL